MLRREFTQSGHAPSVVPPAPKPPRNPYAGAADRIRAGANEIEDEKKIGYKDIPPSQPAPDLQAGLQALYEGRKAGETAQEKPWWQKTLDWVDHHQTGTSIGVGALVGAIAIGVTLVVVGTVTLPVLAVAAGAAALAAGVTVAAGTMGLNAHYDRPSTTNIWNNVKAAAITAAAVTGIGLFVAGGLLTQAAIVTGNAIAGTCAANPAVCANAGVVLDLADKAEEAALTVQLTVETATGNPHAGETAIELQLEQMDGGAPGNTVAAELGEQLTKLGPDALEIAAKYGDDAIPLLLKYGDNAIDIIGAYGDEGITLLRKFGSDTPQAINLIKDFGTPAVRILDTLDVQSAGKLLRNLDAGVLDYAVGQGPDAVSALSKWSPEELKEFGVELALRAESDAKAINAAETLVKLGPLDPSRLTPKQEELIEEIARNSLQNAGKGQVVIGASKGLDDGYVAAAIGTDSTYYHNHQAVWETLGKLGDEQQAQAAWLINQKALESYIAEGAPFEYALRGVDDIEIEEKVVNLVWEGKGETEIVKSLSPGSSFKTRWRELLELYQAGYQKSFDGAANAYILVKP